MAPFATWNGGRNVWETPALAFCGHAAPFSDGWPESGVMRAGSADATPPATAEPPTGLLPTPTAWEQRSDPNVDPRNLLPLAVLRLGQPTAADDDSAAALLPTPLTTDHKNNATAGALGRQSPQLGPVVADLALHQPSHGRPIPEPPPQNRRAHRDVPGFDHEASHPPRLDDGVQTVGELDAHDGTLPGHDETAPDQ